MTSLAPLIEVAALLSGVEVADARSLIGRLHLASSSGRSRLNADGSPLQVCATLTQRGTRVRFLADPATDCIAPEQRRLIAIAAARAVAAHHSSDLGAVLEATATTSLPGAPDEWRSLNNGAVWVAAGLQDRSIALYANLEWAAPLHRVTIAQSWLDQLLGSGSETARSWLSRITARGYLSCVAVEGCDIADARAKLYWRMRAPTTLDEWGVPSTMSPRLGELIQHFVGSRRVRSSGLLYGAGFSLQDGSLTDVKIDVCAHCVHRPPQEWIEAIEHVLASDAVRYLSPSLMQGQAELALVGIGVDVSGTYRINSYLKATSSCS